MPNHMSDLGFLVECRADFEALALLALEQGTELQTASGVYVRWLTGAVVVPSIGEVQLTAFAHELQAYESEAAYAATQSGAVKFATESFIPAGLFNAATNEQNTPPQAYAIFTGRVLDTALITNPATEREFCWAHVRTLGGELDMVADPDLLDGYLTKGGIVGGSFWLSGRFSEWGVSSGNGRG